MSAPAAGAAERKRKRAKNAPRQIAEPQAASGGAAGVGGGGAGAADGDDVMYNAVGDDDPNAYMLPAEGRKAKKKKEEPPPKKRLSATKVSREHRKLTHVVIDFPDNRVGSAMRSLVPPTRHPQAKQVKRLKRVLAVKEKKKQRGALYEKVAASAMPKEQAELLHRTTLMASKLTAKQQLRQQLKEERAGIDVSSQMSKGKGRATIKLSVPRGKSAASADAASASIDAHSSDDDDDDDEEDEEEEEDDDEDASGDASTSGAAAGDNDAGASAAAAAPPPRPIPVPVPSRRPAGAPSAQDLMRRPRIRASEPTRFVPVTRDADVQAARLALPILQEEHAIMEAIHNSNVVIICGETGSGKTTQVPQFLYEAGFTRGGAGGDAAGGGDRPLVGVTEPRRIAAVAMAGRVASELGLTKRHVAYQIRYEGTVSSATEIKFMTDGVLAREIAADFALRRYTAIVVDEAHERSVHTDVLLGLLSRIVPLREAMAKEVVAEGQPPPPPPLKLIIMSATLRVEDFTSNARLFPGIPRVPVLSVDARQFPVTVHFSKVTRVDVDNVAVAFRKVCQIHERLPAGGILVFMSGQTDIWDLVRRLREQYGGRSARAAAGKGRSGGGGKGSSGSSKSSSSSSGGGSGKDGDAMDVDGAAGAAAATADADEAEIDGELSDPEEGHEVGDDSGASAARAARRATALDAAAPSSFGVLHVLPLYSALSSKEQAKVFAPPPEGHRLCIVATNVAETSLTIPGVRYVVDTGQVKNRHYDMTTGVVSYKVEWISKASAGQRAGRAGRTGPGHCYRLYSSAVYQHDFTEFADPEITRMPVDGLVLHMKSMGISKVVNFPFPTPPDPAALRDAEALLVLLGALDCRSKQITRLGRTMAQLAVAPRFAKMLCLSRHYDCHRYVVAVVAALSVPELFAQDTAAALERAEAELDAAASGDTDAAAAGPTPPPKPMEQWRVEGIAKGGDFGALLAAVGACDYVASKGGSLERFCAERCLRHKAMVEVRKLRAQLERHGAAGAGAEMYGHADDEADVDADAAGEGEGEGAEKTTPSLAVTGASAGNSRSSSSGGGSGGGGKKASPAVTGNGRGRSELEPLPPPTPAQEDAVRQIILSGFGDHVARLSSQQQPELAKHGVFAYTCEAVDELVYIHPTSVLHRRKPEFVAYLELQRGKTRLYMRGVTVVQSEWLPRLVPARCAFGKPLEAPPPRYDAGKDDVRCHMAGEFGRLRWAVPPIELSMPGDSPDRFRYFARFVLEGAVFPALRRFTPHLKNRPDVMCKQWIAKERVVALLQPLVDGGIDTAAKLEEAWAAKPKFLLQAFSLWLDSKHHDELVALWPPLRSKGDKGGKAGKSGKGDKAGKASDGK